MGGLDHPHARVLRAQLGPASYGRLLLVQGLGAESQQDRFDDRGVICFT